MLLWLCYRPCGLSACSTHTITSNADRPDSVTIFFGSRKGDVKTLSEIMGIMLRAEDHTCLTSYIKARQQTVAGMMKAAAAGAGGVVPAAAQQERKVQECATVP